MQMNASEQIFTCDLISEETTNNSKKSCRITHNHICVSNRSVQPFLAMSVFPKITDSPEFTYNVENISSSWIMNTTCYSVAAFAEIIIKYESCCNDKGITYSYPRAASGVSCTGSHKQSTEQVTI